MSTKRAKEFLSAVKGESVEQLQSRFQTMTSELAKMKLTKKIKPQEVKAHEIREMRKNIARILTVVNDPSAAK
eukprot:CAMPEP_0196657268 /NCGR_PEP_ID=MMETSP1086-20130531/22543_1 /TAXON_ID=77921 /ORGANISM="Cyanoptyche  gloeocystis , Strain SAG4.97" /LENGTH=72 /DNA_ID=CAMNT_0041990329 /DNA_START=81 /DNA_END=299 /DNA_ORIENTATION=+